MKRDVVQAHLMKGAILVAAASLAAACAGPFGGGERSYDFDRAPLSQRPEAYTSPEALRVAEILEEHQQNSGGWAFSFRMERVVAASDPPTPDPEATNGWTLGTAWAIKFLARVQQETGSDRYEPIILRGIDFLHEAQYPNGGWPKIHPQRGVVEPVMSKYTPQGRYGLITFNDNTTADVMGALLEVARGESGFAFVDEARRSRAWEAVEKGTEMILRLQLSDDGVRTGWAQMYDEHTLEPVWGRKFEPRAVTSHETANVIRFLMRLEEPSPAVIEAVHTGVAWLERVKLTGIREVIDPEPVSAPNWNHTVVFTGRHERTMVEDPAAPPIWARFYEIGTDRPVFASGDDTVRYSMAELTVERRTGYDWYGSWPRKLLQEEYPAWSRRRGR